MHQQFAGPECVVIGNVPVGVRTDMYVEQKGFTILDEPVGVFEIGLAFADGLDLGSAQDYAGLDLIVQEVIEARAAIERGIPLAAGDGVARPGRFGRRLSGWDDGMTGLARHGETSSNLNLSTGSADNLCTVELC